jgi:hypothetical protein
MDKQNLNNLQEEVEKKYKKREKKKRRTMKVSGAGVKSLQKIIKNK